MHTYAEVVARWPKWFDVNGDIRHTLMPFGFPQNGWAEIIWRLCEDIEPVVANFPPGQSFEVLQVKEKFGGLRFYCTHDGTDGIRERILQAENEADKTCEYCGQAGKPRAGGWIKTLCESCRMKR